MSDSHVAGGMVPQAELYHDRRVLDPRCLVCLGAAGTRYHRIFCCDAHAGFRSVLGFSELRRWQQGDPQDPLRSRCLEASVLPYTPRLRGVNRWHWGIHPRHGWIQGNVCSDGSALMPEIPLFTRAAWALVVVDDAGQVLASACGQLAHGLHTIYGAEVFAIVMALRLSGPDPVVCATGC